jgi:hypothetical protein
MAYYTPGNGSENGGAWPRGRRRNPDQPGESAADCVRRLRECGLYWHEIAAATDISDRALRAYMSGRLWPSTRRLARLQRVAKNLAGVEV